jgi:hypothetical protein
MRLLKKVQFIFILCLVILGSSKKIIGQNDFYTNVINVNVNSEWTDSGIFIATGDTIFLHGFGAYSPVSSGYVWADMSAAPEGLGWDVHTLPGFPYNRIIARIGENDTLFASGNHFFISKVNGNLFFTTNDWKGTYSDNRGTVIVFVRHAKNKNTTTIMNKGHLSIESQLQQNYPNPFNPYTIIDYSVQKAGVVRLEIYNSLGQHVRTLVDDEKNIGEYSVIWNGKNNKNETVSNGTYFYRIRVGDTVTEKKMLLLK